MGLTAAELAETDVVYYVRAGETNEELRWSLRSLAHLPHRKVWIVGHKPKWVKGVATIPGNPLPARLDFANGYENVRTIARFDGDMTENIVIMNDDFLILREVSELPLYARGPLQEHINITEPSTDWGRSLRLTRDLLLSRGHLDPLSYELHVPIPIHRPTLLEAVGPDLRLSLPDIPVQWRTMYGAHQTGPATFRSDVKIKTSKPGMFDGLDFISTTDRLSRRPRVAGEANRLIPKGSRYVR